MKDKDYELSTEPKPNPMNIENLQEWIDMPLGKVQYVSEGNYYIHRVPGGWVISDSRNSTFVPEPKNGVRNKPFPHESPFEWRGCEYDPYKDFGVNIKAQTPL